MDKNARLMLIRKTYYDLRRERRKLTPKAWQFIQELRKESRSGTTNTILACSEGDIREEIYLMGGSRRFANGARYADSRYSA